MSSKRCFSKITSVKAECIYFSVADKIESSFECPLNFKSHYFSKANWVDLNILTLMRKFRSSSSEFIKHKVSSLNETKLKSNEEQVCRY